MKLSFIIPAYNAASTIESCVNSITCQKNHSLQVEILIFNDGSSDNTLEVINELSKKHENVLVFDNENQGVYKTRNLALDKVTGDFVWLIDADDIIAPNSLEIVSNHLQQNLEILRFGYYEENHKQEIIKRTPKIINKKINGSTFLNNNDGRLYLWCHIFNVNFLNNSNLRFPAKSMSLEDSYFCLSVFAKSKSVYCIKDYLYTYKYMASSISKKNSIENRLKQAKSSYNVHKEMFKLKNSYKENEITYNTIDNVLSHSSLGFFYSLLKEKYPIKFVEGYYDKYKKENLFPKITKSSNFKAILFQKTLSIKPLYLFICKLNLAR